MAWKCERQPFYVLYKPWWWEIYNSAYGMSWGRTWTKRGAGKAMLLEQGRWFGG
jgi:hypothetical protein